MKGAPHGRYVTNRENKLTSGVCGRETRFDKHSPEVLALVGGVDGEDVEDYDALVW